MAKKTIVPGGVDEYIAACPEEAQSNLKMFRSVIQKIAPDAIETVSYFKFPGYGYINEGYDYNGMFVWFSYKKPYVRLHLRPPVVADHAKELAGNLMNVGAVSFPTDVNISPALVEKLVKASLNVMKGK